MASVISSDVVTDRAGKNGRRYIRVNFLVEDHDGEQHLEIRRKASVGPEFDVDAWKNAYSGELLEQLAQAEEAEGLDLTRVDNPLVYALNPKWSTTKRIAIAMINWMMDKDTGRDIRSVIYLEPLILYIQENFTAQQVADLLDRTLDQVQRLNRRVNAVLIAVGTMKAHLAAYDAEAE